MTEKDKTLYYRGLVAANIKRLRQARHMGQKELAEESHVGIATISNLERALYNPDLSVLLSIAEVAEMIHLAKNKYYADWVINADADEFYYSSCLDLKKSILQSEGGNVLWVDSIFIFPEDRKDWLNSSYFVTRPFQKFEADALGITGNSLYEEFIGSQGCTKVIHKTHGFVRISDGNHDAKMRFRKKIHSADIRLYHYHIRSYLGWEQKVARWADSIFLLPDGQGEHMKHMVRLYQAGKLKDEFEQKYGSQMREYLQKHGVVSNDPSVKNFLRYKGII